MAESDPRDRRLLTGVLSDPVWSISDKEVSVAEIALPWPPSELKNEIRSRLDAAEDPADIYDLQSASLDLEIVDEAIAANDAMLAVERALAVVAALARWEARPVRRKIEMGEQYSAVQSRRRGPTAFENEDQCRAAGEWVRDAIARGDNANSAYRLAIRKALTEFNKTVSRSTVMRAYKKYFEQPKCG